MKWLANQAEKHDRKPKDVCSVYNLTERRVQQLAIEFMETKKYPELISSRRPKTNLSPAQEKIIETAYKETLLSPKLLYYEIKRRRAYAPKNKIYSFMKSKGWIKMSLISKRRGKDVDMKESTVAPSFMQITTGKQKTILIAYSG